MLEICKKASMTKTLQFIQFKIITSREQLDGKKNKYHQNKVTIDIANVYSSFS